MLGIGAGVAVVVIAGIWGITAALKKGPPRLNDATVVLVKYCSTPDFEKMAFDQQRQYLKVLEEREDKGDVERAFRDGKITEAEYRATLVNAELGKHLGRMEKYYAVPPGQPRTNYLNRLIDKKEKKAKLKPTTKPDEDEMVPDKEVEKLRIEAWPADVREQWRQYQTSYKDLKHLREQVTKPQSRPTDK